MTDKEKCQLIYCTFPDAEEARAVSKRVVGDKFAACANIFSPHEAIYEWDGKICEGKEVAVLYKTKASKVPDLIKVIEDAHSYDTPCVVALPINCGAEKFMQWISQQTY